MSARSARPSQSIRSIAPSSTAGDAWPPPLPSGSFVGRSSFLTRRLLECLDEVLDILGVLVVDACVASM